MLGAFKPRPCPLPVPESLIAQEEREILDLLASAWNRFVELTDKHPSDCEEFRLAIHAAQNLIAFRIARRADPEVWSGAKEPPPGVA